MARVLVIEDDRRSSAEIAAALGDHGFDVECVYNGRDGLLKATADNPVDVKRYQDEDMIIIGTPEMCLEKVLKYAEVGVDQLLCYMQFGMLPHESIMRSIELMGTQIID